MDKNMVDQFVRGIPLYAAVAFQAITAALPTIILWLSFFYGVLQLWYMVKKVFKSGENNDDENKTGAAGA